MYKMGWHQTECWQMHHEDSRVQFLRLTVLTWWSQAQPRQGLSSRGIAATVEQKAAPHFPSLVNYVAPFIPRLAEHTAPLLELLRDDVEYQWSPLHTQIFNSIKALIASETTPAYYDQKQPMILRVDASTRGLGATLVRNGRPIAFASKALTPAETTYANIERELLVVPYGCEKYMVENPQQNTSDQTHWSPSDQPLNTLPHTTLQTNHPVDTLQKTQP